jgi:hypothetical protein
MTTYGHRARPAHPLKGRPGRPGVVATCRSLADPHPYTLADPGSAYGQRKAPGSAYVRIAPSFSPRTIGDRTLPTATAGYLVLRLRMCSFLSAGNGS